MSQKIVIVALALFIVAVSSMAAPEPDTNEEVYKPVSTVFA